MKPEFFEKLQIFLSGHPVERKSIEERCEKQLGVKNVSTFKKLNYKQRLKLDNKHDFWTPDQPENMVFTTNLKRIFNNTQPTKSTSEKQTEVFKTESFQKTNL